MHFKVLKELRLPVMKKLILCVIVPESAVLKIHNHCLANRSMYIKVIVSLSHKNYCFLSRDKIEMDSKSYIRRIVSLIIFHLFSFYAIQFAFSSVLF